MNDFSTSLSHARPSHNRLIEATSPYLLEHARNPVDWFPWGEEAFDRARSQEKPIFLSIGYSTCHWCHVMERESFRHEEVAGILNEHFVSIKVDREERPDLDEIYMMATQLMTGRGGWPNSVWLTPEKQPWYAGTYFPREDSWGRPGFKTVLIQLSQIWRSKSQEVRNRAQHVSMAMARITSERRLKGGGVGGGVEPKHLVSASVDMMRQSFDVEHGGFGLAPKFPPHSSLNLLFFLTERDGSEDLHPMILRTLDGMAMGGIRDHLGGGFHRYATEPSWGAPHFEKMLYDNAQLALAYAKAYRLTGNDFYAQVASETYAWVLEDLRSPEGAFFSAVDADSQGGEGLYYLWSKGEILDVLGQEACEFFCDVYGVSVEGNHGDEATGRLTGMNVLSLQKVPDVKDAALASCRRKLLERRRGRVHPFIDDKIIAGWNGLMVESLALGGICLRQESWVDAAAEAAEFLWSRMRQEGKLYRSFRKGGLAGHGYLDDYAFLACGLLALYEARGTSVYLHQAVTLAEEMIERFEDSRMGGFFLSSGDHESLILRTKDIHDNALPSGNGAACRLLIRLGRVTQDSRFREYAQRSLRAFMGAMREIPLGTEGLILALATEMSDPEGSPITGSDFLITGQEECRRDSQTVCSESEGCCACQDADQKLQSFQEDETTP